MKTSINENDYGPRTAMEGELTPTTANINYYFAKPFQSLFLDVEGSQGGDVIPLELVDEIKSSNISIDSK